MKRPTYLTLYDFRQAFDSLWLNDCILSLWKLGLRNELLPLIYKLNVRATVTVNTPYGRCNPFTTEDIIKQGAVLSSNLCSVNTGEICNLDQSVAIGSVPIKPLAFVDDIAKINIIWEEIIASHGRAVAFSKLKKQDFNETKCYGMIVNGCENEKFPELTIKWSYHRNQKVDQISRRYSQQ